MARFLRWASIISICMALAVLSTAALLVAHDRFADREQHESTLARDGEPSLVIMGAYSDDAAAESKVAAEAHRATLIDQIGREPLQALRRKEAAAIRAYLNDFVLRM